MSMLSSLVQFAHVNGHRYSRTSLRLVWDGTEVSGFTSINFKAAVAPGMSYGSRSLPQGRTRGKTTLTGDVELYEEDFQILWQYLAAKGQQLAQGPAEVACTVVLTRYEALRGTVGTRLIGARVTEDDSSNGDNDDQAKRKLTLSIMNITENDVPFVIENSPSGF